ncbi:MULTISPECIES: hypothetical protein [unclassified Flavobacterium]|uniref:hypothetical protein n=1 Tax=unclassified Flavobacterium TaxID=196869 RepID=UPI001F135156|nr:MULTISPECIES: hypothetical protein [unclassified Flavobacterium]UMY65769.1 hypothetical protein MKO97_14915 [Flavobacterium sp. HJ-32-4]
MEKTNPNVIPLKQAQDWAANWQKDNTLKAFLIQKDNIDSILAAGGNVANFRGYLGLDDAGDPVFMLVGVDASGNDIINEEDGYYVYDFNDPCPRTCSPGSPLIMK